ncbi:acyl-coa n-acyltransferase [Lucifera butyrica]|uniref:Acyl-coa n-acyltransferase n=1 Tax=Lucifera butyrica TaxID=1351585 RepID=A0A498R2S0_9FIRM|nr:GNAT family N-acetyltransferase [Lucifera butyrica]VBB05691.1 acyl-coa n-acyltransferase [Lucifera butyrica]
MINVTYYSFRKEDCQEVLNLWLNIPGIHLHSNGEDSIEGIAAYLERNQGCSFVAKYDGKIIGAVMCGHDGRRGFIHHLAVDNKFRRMEIGKTLVQISLEQLRKVSIKKCALFVLKENTEAENFYKSLQWQEEDIVKIYAKIL